MGGGASKPIGKPGIDRPFTKSELEAIPKLSVPMLHVFGPKRGTTSVLKFRALRAPETIADAEIRVHRALTTAGLPATETAVQKIVDQLIEFTQENGYQISNNESRRRPTVAQALVSSAARAIFVQYDVDRSGAIDANELAAMIGHVHQARTAASNEDDAADITLKELDTSLASASKIIAALDSDGNGYLEEDEFCDSIVRSFGWSTEQRLKNISKLSRKDPEMTECFENFFSGVRFCVGHIIKQTSAAIVDRCLNPPETLAKSEAELLAAESVASANSLPENEEDAY